MLTCTFQFTRNSGAVYEPGQVVTGDVKLTITKAIFVQGIHIEILGYAEVLDGKNFHDQEVFWTHKHYYIGGQDRERSYLINGVQKYAFQKRLPLDTLPSIDILNGNISYKIIVTVENSDGSNEEFKTKFDVIRSVDLNTIDWCKNAIFNEDEKSVNSCCYNNGTIKAVIRTPYSGYAPGQTIPFKVRIENESTVDCTAEVKFKKKIQFKCRNSEKIIQYSFLICENSLPEVKKLSNKEFEGCIKLPTELTVSLLDCNLITMSYYIKVTVVTPIFYTEFSLYSDVAVGDIPLLETLDSPNEGGPVVRQPTLSQVTTSLESTNSSNNPPPASDDVEPPSYEEAISTMLLPLNITSISS